MNWRLGLFTEMLSNQAMGQIYQVLKSSGFEWKVKTPYHIITKKIAEGKTDKQTDTGHPPTRIGIQLYRMHERHDKGYLVDIVIHCDLVFPAIDDVYELYTKINAKIGA